MSTWIWPPPPHDPRERVLVDRAAAWEARVFARSDAKHDYFAARGLLHLQLWHPRAGVSVLTPSRLTREKFELFPIREWKQRVSSADELAKVLRCEHGLILPPARVLEAWHEWYVRGFERTVSRTMAGASSEDRA